MASSSKMFMLRTSDNETFEVEEEVMMQSQTLKNLIEDDLAMDGGIPLPNIKAKIMAMVIQYCKTHVSTTKPSDDDKTDDYIKNWDEDFMKIDQAILFELILAANYLDIKGLLDLTCEAAADLIKGKSPEEIRKTFNIQNDFTPEEEEEIMRENRWAFE